MWVGGATGAVSLGKEAQVCQQGDRLDFHSRQGSPEGCHQHVPEVAARAFADCRGTLVVRAKDALQEYYDQSSEGLELGNRNQSRDPESASRTAGAGDGIRKGLGKGHALA